MRGNAESMRVLYGWLEVQIPARLGDATQSGIHWCKHRAGGKVAVFSILCAINLKKKRFTLQNKKLISVFWQKTQVVLGELQSKFKKSSAQWRLWKRFSFLSGAK